MSLQDSCGCPAGRPLGAPHLPGCSQAVDKVPPVLRDEPANVLAGPHPNVVQIYRNPETQRPVAVPDEIVSAAEREYRAWKLHTSGKSWAEVAATEGYDDARAASAAVRRYLDEAVAVVQDFTREQVIADHLGRLAMYRQALWAGATAGKTQHVMASLAVEDRWVKAFGLDQPDADGANQQTVVVIDSEGEYVRKLRAVAGEPEPEASAG